MENFLHENGALGQLLLRLCEAVEGMREELVRIGEILQDVAPIRRRP